jgi:hypothetical protein
MATPQIMSPKDSPQGGVFVDIDLSPSEMKSKDNLQNQPGLGFQPTPGMLYGPSPWGSATNETLLPPVPTSTEINGSTVPIPNSRSVAYQQPAQSHRKSERCCTCCYVCCQCLGECLDSLWECLMCYWMLKLCSGGGNGGGNGGCDFKCCDCDCGDCDCDCDL